MAQPTGLLFSKEHEWANVEGDIATIGITDHAQHSLGDIVYVELPVVGAKVDQFGNIGVVESVKAVSELFTPIGGEIIAVNKAVEDDPSLVNRDAYGEGWLFKMKIADVNEKDNLLSSQAYDDLISAEE